MYKICPQKGGVVRPPNPPHPPPPTALVFNICMFLTCLCWTQHSWITFTVYLKCNIANPIPQISCLVRILLHFLPPIFLPPAASITLLLLWRAKSGKLPLPASGLPLIAGCIFVTSPTIRGTSDDDTGVSRKSAHFYFRCSKRRKRKHHQRSDGSTSGLTGSESDHQQSISLWVQHHLTDGLLVRSLYTNQKGYHI